MIKFIKYMSLSWREQEFHSWCDEEFLINKMNRLIWIIYPNAQDSGMGFRIKYN